MGPRLKGRGNGRDKCPGMDDRLASMGPRLKGRGNSSDPIGAVLRVGLQWGRVLKDAETEILSIELTVSSRFNGAAS